MQGPPSRPPAPVPRWRLSLRQALPAAPQGMAPASPIVLALPALARTVPEPVAYAQNALGGATMPVTPGLDVVIFTLGQSFADAHVDPEHAREEDAWSIAPIPGVVMPANGFLPTRAFRAYQPARAVPTGGQPLEYAAFEATRRLRAHWLAQG